MFNYEDLLNSNLGNSNGQEDYLNTEIEEGEYITNHQPEKFDENKALFSSKKKKKKNKKRKIKIEIDDQNFKSNINFQITIISCEKTLFITKTKFINFQTDVSNFEKGRLESGPDSRAIDIPDPKFWINRYYYFSKYDEGILMDYESWYSVTPEELAIYIADICRGRSVIDAFCGCGGNTIKFSEVCSKVICIDIDPIKINLTKNNSNVYKCKDNITFICEDFLKISSHMIKADYIFISPPWGGMDYKDQKNYSLKESITPNIYDIISISIKLAEKMIFYLPRNTSIDEFCEILSEVYRNSNISNENFIFLDIQMLNSANKVKALLIVIGDKSSDKISIKDLRKYLKTKYKALEEYQLCQLSNISKIIGINEFFLSEYSFFNSKINYIESNKNISDKSKGFNLIKYFKDEMMTPEDVNKLKEIDKNEKKNRKNNKDENIYSFLNFDRDQIITQEEYDFLINNLI